MNPILFNKKSAIRRGLLAAALLGVVSIPVMARIGAPVLLSMGSPDALSVGQPVTVFVVIQAAADLSHANFDLLPSNDWQILDGASFWTGSLSKDRLTEFQFRAVPLRDDPQALRGRVRIGGFPARFADLDPARMGGRFPEKMRAPDGKDDRNAAAKDEEAETAYDPANLEAEPAAATEPRVPGLPPAVANNSKTKAKGSAAHAAAVNVTATGQFVYADDNGANRVVRGATVELWNRNPGWIDEKCGDSRSTDDNGRFTLTGTCGDWDGNPDLFVRIVLNNSVVEVKPDSIFAGSFTFDSAVRNNVSGTVNLGTITITSSQEAFHIHNLIMRANRFMRDLGESMSKVTVNFPAPKTNYTMFMAAIAVTSGDGFGSEASVFHEYGHHVLFTKAESPAPDYDFDGDGNEIETGCSSSHCFMLPERGVVSWTEGWPDFFGAVVHRTFNTQDGYGTTRNLESAHDPSTVTGFEDRIEGVIATTLWDLFDTAQDDQGPTGPGRRDNFSLPFSVMWQIVKQFDPAPGDLLHNHPTSIREFWDGLRAFRLDDINAISEVYGEHNLFMPQPNLVVTAVSNPPAATGRGQSFSVTATVRNSGNELVNNGNLTSLALAPEFGTPVQLVSVITARLDAGESTTFTISVTVPSNLARGIYRVRACADSGGVVPEANETDNCRNSSGSFTIRF
jgi:hypothetical protein